MGDEEDVFRVKGSRIVENPCCYCWWWYWSGAGVSAGTGAGAGAGAGDIETLAPVLPFYCTLNTLPPTLVPRWVGWLVGSLVGWLVRWLVGWLAASTAAVTPTTGFSVEGISQSSPSIEKAGYIFENYIRSSGFRGM
ncbi:hypothetical protein M0802_000385 [Mischocyttarus mexicanus]|nr:hypothetical protein M0802_000385 [Mischocyttarus mexicanus]